MITDFNNSGDGYGLEEDDYRVIPRSRYRKAIRNPFFRALILEMSLYEDEENTYYTGLLNTLSEHIVGTTPLILGDHPSPEVNISVEKAWLDWSAANGIGESIRQIRRNASKMGIGIGIPYNREDSIDEVPLSIRVVKCTDLTSPRGATKYDRIINGIEYDSNWDPYKIYVSTSDSFEPEPYYVKDILFYQKVIDGDPTLAAPECGPAFCLYPKIRRYMDAIVSGEEFKASMPMAVELDPNVYTPQDAGIEGAPKGSMKYKPNTIPTLPPGTKLAGLPPGTSSSDKKAFMELVVAAAARCVNMPKNIAMADSSGHNMATAAIDIQPWEDHVKIERFDFKRMVIKLVKMWHERAIRTTGYIDIRARNKFKFDVAYDKTFQHPDPKKRADSRTVDLKSGSTTLHRIYTDSGMNVERELNKEAKTLGITRQRLNEMIIATRVSKPDMLMEDAADEAVTRRQEDEE